MKIAVFWRPSIKRSWKILKKSFENVHLDARIYLISPDLLWNSTTIIILLTTHLNVKLNDNNHFFALTILLHIFAVWLYLNILVDIFSVWISSQSSYSEKYYNQVKGYSPFFEKWGGPTSLGPFFQKEWGLETLFSLIWPKNWVGPGHRSWPVRRLHPCQVN